MTEIESQRAVARFNELVKLRVAHADAQTLLKQCLEAVWSLSDRSLSYYDQSRYQRAIDHLEESDMLLDFTNMDIGLRATAPAKKKKPWKKKKKKPWKKP